MYYGLSSDGCRSWLAVKSSMSLSASHFNDGSLEFNCCCHGYWVFLVGVFFVCRVHDWQAWAGVPGPEWKSSRTETDPQQNPWWNQWPSPFPADNQVRTYSCAHSHTNNNNNNNNKKNSLAPFSPFASWLSYHYVSFYFYTCPDRVSFWSIYLIFKEMSGSCFTLKSKDIFDIIKWSLFSKSS